MSIGEGNAHVKRDANPWLYNLVLETELKTVKDVILIRRTIPAEKPRNHTHRTDYILRTSTICTGRKRLLEEDLVRVI
jgi:hypothetical protein